MIPHDIASITDQLASVPQFLDEARFDLSLRPSGTAALTG